MSNKFEQLIEYVINDDDAKASELFHDIVVGKSREIYESLMGEEEVIGGDEVEDFIDDVSADEEGIDYDDDGETDEHEEDHEELEDRVVDLEDKLDELMAEFDALVTDGETESDDEEMGMDSEEEMEMDSEEEMEMESTEKVIEEGAELKAAPKPVTSEEGSVNKDGANNDNGGKDTSTGGEPAMSSGEEKGRSAPKAKDMDAKGPQDAGNLEAAPKPVTKA